MYYYYYYACNKRVLHLEAYLLLEALLVNLHDALVVDPLVIPKDEATQLRARAIAKRALTCPSIPDSGCSSVAWAGRLSLGQPARSVRVVLLARTELLLPPHRRIQAIKR